MSQTPEDPKPNFEMVALSVPFPDEFVYTNACAFALTENDVRISFCEAMPDRSVKAKVGVVMPVEQAAYIMFNLMSMLTAFERGTGPIRNKQWRNFISQANLIAKTALESNPPTSEFPAPSPEGSHQPPASPEPPA